MYDRPYMIKHTHNFNNIEKKNTGVRVMVMVFNATFNNISVLSCRSDLLVDETGVTGENQRPVASHGQTLSHTIVSSTHLLSGIRTHNFSSDRH